MNYERDEYGELCTKLNGKYHSFDDKPAVIDEQGTRAWYKEGKIHRDSHFPGREDDLPAVIHEDGRREWWIDGKFIKYCVSLVTRVKSARKI